MPAVAAFGAGTFSFGSAAAGALFSTAAGWGAAGAFYSGAAAGGCSFGAATINSAGFAVQEEAVSDRVDGVETVRIGILFRS